MFVILMKAMQEILKLLI